MTASWRRRYLLIKARYLEWNENWGQCRGVKLWKRERARRVNDTTHARLQQIVSVVDIF